MLKRVAICLMIVSLVLAGVHLAFATKETIKGVGVKGVKEVLDKIAPAFSKAHPGIKVTTEEKGAPETVEAIGKGTPGVHFGMMTRLPDSKEAAAYPDLKTHLFARDGVVLIVHPDNPVTGLTTAQVRDIYAGRIKCWSKVGGKKGVISPFVREKGSGQRIAVEDAVMGGEKVKVGLREIGSMGGMKTEVSIDSSALGYILMSAVDKTVKPLSLDGVAPTIENVKAGTYKIIIPFYLYTKGDPKGATKTFIDYLLSPAGQKQVEKQKLAPVK